MKEKQKHCMNKITTKPW